MFVIWPVVLWTNCSLNGFVAFVGAIQFVYFVVHVTDVFCYLPVWISAAIGANRIGMQATKHNPIDISSCRRIENVN